MKALLSELWASLLDELIGWFLFVVLVCIPVGLFVLIKYLTVGHIWQRGDLF